VARRPDIDLQRGWDNAPLKDAWAARRDHDFAIQAMALVPVEVTALGASGPSGVDWALFFKRTVSREVDQQAHREFVSGMRDAIATTAAWPDVDLFSQY
jgi:hypothetical protein